MAPKLYVFRTSPAVRAVQVTAKALGLTLDEYELDGSKAEHLSAEYLQLNPLHTAPTLNDNGNIICDSHAINAYLVGKYGKDESLYPKDLYKRALVDQKLAFDLGVLFPLLKTVNLAYAKGEIKSVPSKMINDIKESYRFLENFLEKNQWISTDSVTIADFSCVTTITCLDVHVNVDPTIYPNTAGWIKRVRMLPCFSSDDEGLNGFKNIIKSLKS